MDWVMIVIFALAAGGYQIEEELIGSREQCSLVAHHAYTQRDTPDRMAVAANCYRKSWPERAPRT